MGEDLGSHVEQKECGTGARNRTRWENNWIPALSVIFEPKDCEPETLSHNFLLGKMGGRAIIRLPSHRSCSEAQIENPLKEAPPT